jgi:hypothetical protein
MRPPTRNRGEKDHFPAKKAKREIVLLSILLHVLVLAFWDSAMRLSLAPLIPVAPPAPAAAQPLVFDLEPPERPREVIATLDDARSASPPKQTDFLSDQNALARNQEPAPGLPLTNDPFSRGDLDSHELPAPPPAPERNTEPPAVGQPETETGEKNEPPDIEVRPDGEWAREKAPPAAPKRFRFDLPRVPHRQLEGRAAEEGGLSFNTYDWDFAPYMLALKERIGRNIFPPLAFSKLGMIDGNTLLRFKIYPDGRLADMELLGYDGHHSLMETSRFAVTASAPFPGLPSDFPKDFLEVTAKFSYFIRR